MDRVNGTPLRCDTSVRTASGIEHRIQTKIILPVKYSTHDILFYIWHSLEQQMYLGVDIWKKFEIASEIFAVSEVNMEYLQIKVYPRTRSV